MVSLRRNAKDDAVSLEQPSHVQPRRQYLVPAKPLRTTLQWSRCDQEIASKNTTLAGGLPNLQGCQRQAYVLVSEKTASPAQKGIRLSNEYTNR